MKRVAIFTMLFSLSAAYSVQGQNLPRQPPPPAAGMIFQLNPDYQPHTGDRDFDSLLMEINRTAADRIEQYLGDISSAFHVPRENVITLLAEERMQPADIFMIFQIARLSGQPDKNILPHFRQHRGKGWGAVVLALGIKPGSTQFVVLRQDVPMIIWNYAVMWQDTHWSKGSKLKKGSKKKKGSKGRR